MADLTSKAMKLAAAQHGALSISQLVASRVSRHTVRRLERSGVLLVAYKTVRRLAGSRRTLEQRCAELCLAHPTAFVTGPTAGILLGLRKMPRHSPIVLSSLHPLHVEHVGVRTRRSTKVDATDTVRRPDGIATARPVRLAFDLAADLRVQAHRSIVDQLIHEHGVTIEQLAAIGSRLYHPKRPGSDRFAETLQGLSDYPAESDAELLVAEALRERGVPIEANERWLDLPNGRKARLDLSVSNARWGVEVDVHPSHLGVIGSTNDKRRDRQARLIGWTIERVTGLDLIHLEATADELTLLYKRRVIELAG